MLFTNKNTTRTIDYFSIKIVFLLLFSLFFKLEVNAQMYISGKVTDTSAVALAYVNLQIENPENQEIITWGTTDEEGFFDIKIKEKGDYILKINYLGYKEKQIPLMLQKDKELFIRLEENEEFLEEIVIKSTLPTIQQKTDRLVFNVDQTPSGSVGTANDALKNTPGVQIENEELKMIGKGEVKVLINDKIIRLSGEELYIYLNTIPADNIKNIEVISTPPSKYEAEGNSGLINIVLKKAKKDSWSNTLRTNYKQQSYASFGIGNAFLYHKDKLEISASLDATKGYRKRKNDLLLYFDKELWKEPLRFKDKLDNISGKFSLDYTLSEKSSIGISYNGALKDNDITDYSLTQIYDNNHELIGNLNSSGFSDNTVKSHNLGGYFEHKIDTLGRKFSLNLDYFNYQNIQDRNSITTANYSGHENTEIENANNQYIDNYSFSFDFEHPTDWAKFSYGTKLLFTKNRNRLKELINENDNSNMQKDHFKYRENVQAAYVDITKEFNEKWTAKVGARLEYTDIKGISIDEENEFKKNYMKLFPTAFLNFNADKNNVFNLSYSRRINRPGFWALNPSRWYINSVSYTEGNPFLQPAFSDNIELKHIYKNKLISTLFVSTENQGFDQIPSVNQETNQQIYTVENFYDLISFGIRENFHFNPFPWWKTMTQTGVFYTDGRFKKDFEDLGTMNRGMNFQFYTNHSFSLNAKKTLQLETTFNYQSSFKTLMFEIDDYSYLDLGFKALLFKENLQVNLYFQDVYKGIRPKATTYTNDVKQVYGNYFDSRSVNLSLTYKFGNENLKTKSRENKNTEIQSRTN